MFKLRIFLAVLILSGCVATTGTVPNSVLPLQSGDSNSSQSAKILNPFVQVDNNGSTSLVANLLDQALNQMPKSELSPAETAGLLQMREEEKLAKDVYTTLAGLWGQTQTFKNISVSEASHTESVRTLLERYQVTDPAQTEGGKFTSPTLQSLYDQLVGQGKESLMAALQVGLKIEELDIVDLQKHQAASDQEDVRLVYKELERGSRNHLRAFYKALLSNGGTYHAAHLSQADFDTIAQGAIERAKS